MYYTNEHLYVEGNYVQKSNFILYFLCNLKNYFPFVGKDIAQAYGIFINGNKLRFSSSVDNIAQKRSYISMHHKDAFLVKTIDLYLQFINSSIFEQPTTVITNVCFKEKYKLLNYLFNSMASVFFCNFSIKGFTTDEKYWAIVTCLKEKNSVSVFPDREGQQFNGDTNYHFRDGLFAASIFTQSCILNYCVVDKSEIDEFIDIHVQQFVPPKIIVDYCKNAHEYAQWRKNNFDLIWAFTLKCEKLHKEKIKQLEDMKSSCPIGGHENEFCEISNNTKNMDVRISLNNRYFAHKQKIGVKKLF